MKELEKVVLGGCASYELGPLKELFTRGFEETGFRPRNCKVLLKPNLLAAKAPEKAVTTHPLFLKALAEILLDSSCQVHIGDSPGYEGVERVLKASGLMEVVEELDLTIASFRKKIVKKRKGLSPYTMFTFGEDPDEYDLVINVPKLKTHGMMGLTLGVKNTFGFIQAFEKARWHLRAGTDRRLFAALLIAIHAIAHPAITILDGVLGLDGERPSRGRPRPFGIVAFSKDALVLDRAMEKTLRLPALLPVSAAAEAAGLMKESRVVDLGAPAVDHFLLPKSVVATDWNLPLFLKGALKAVFVKKPRLDQPKCRLCGVCVRVCPSEALQMKEQGPIFDYQKCIRCYCCQEMCPEGAVVV